MKAKIVIIIVLVVLLIIFVLQNTETVAIQFWFWEMSIPRALLLFVCFSVGLIVGLMIPSNGRNKEGVPDS